MRAFADVELAAVGVLATIGHRDGVVHMRKRGIDFVPKSVAGTVGAEAVAGAGLAHEAGDDAVKDDAAVKGVVADCAGILIEPAALTGREADEVGDGPGSFHIFQGDGEGARDRAADLHVGIDLRDRFERKQEREGEQAEGEQSFGEHGNNDGEDSASCPLLKLASECGFCEKRFAGAGFSFLLRVPMSAEFDVRYTAKLARLHLSEDEITKFQAQLSQVLQYVEKLEQVNVEGVEPTAHANAIFNVLRKDESRPGFTQKEALANAPRQANGLFIVPKVIE